MQHPLKKIFAQVARIGANSSDSDELRVKKAVLVSLVALGGIPSQTFIGVLLVVFDQWVEGWFLLSYAGVNSLSLAYVAFTRRGYTFLLYSQILLVLAVPFVLAAYGGGFLNCGACTTWGILGPLLALVLTEPLPALLWFLAYVGLVILGGTAQPSGQITAEMPVSVMISLFTINILGPASLAFGMLYYFLLQRNQAFRLLRGEQEKSEKLLLNVLPQDIAAILKNEQRTIADQFEGASILFADVVNFTPLSAQLTAVELVELLNEVFTHFDTLVEKYGLEKIKTIGDCYMVASGVPRPRADHAQVLTRLGLEMQAYVASREFRGRKLAFRIGINSGPVVAGVIGRKKFIYDLWGDAVNTASRMESHGSGGLIQITQATYALIHEEFVCEPRGTINIKGKGEMEVWYVISQKSQSA